MFGVPWWIWTHGICIVGGIVVGALIWRNNAKRFESMIKKGEAVVGEIKK